MSRQRKLYESLAVGAALSVDLADTLAARGLAHITVCPDCGADAFTHEKGCATFARVQRNIDTALTQYGRTA